MPQFTLDVEKSFVFFLNLCQVSNHVWSGMQNEQKASSWNTFYRTSSVAFNMDRTLSLDHWAPTVEVLWNALQAVPFSVFVTKLCQASAHMSMKTHILHINPIIYSNKNNYLVLLGGKMQSVLPTTTQSGKEVNWYTWQSPALFPSQVLVISWKIRWLLKLKFLRVLEAWEFLLRFYGLFFLLIENSIT